MTWTGDDDRAVAGPQPGEEDRLRCGQGRQIVIANTMLAGLDVPVGVGTLTIRNSTATCYPDAKLVLHYEVGTPPGTA
jgi:hypothetical protein